MQMTATRFTKSDMAKYPFLKENAEYVKRLNLKIEDLSSPELAHIVQRAEERVEDSILYSLVSRRTHNDEVEILSFPVAIMLTIATQNPFIKKRYALAEAKQAYEDLKLEPKERILAIANNFGWKLTSNSDVGVPYEFSLSFTDYLRSTTRLRERRWKLVNRLLSNGKVYLTRNEVPRLLSEEVRSHVEESLEIEDIPKFPTVIVEMAEKMKKLSAEKIGQTEMEGFPKEIVQTAFPPCIEALYQAFTSGRHLSHIGRFALTSFLVNIGMPSERVIELFKNISDFNERMTRYQVEHIAGERGSRTRYITPKCGTLKTHGVCMNPDRLCQQVQHPLGYYRRKLARST
jgi:DNA primase large subunit